MCFHSTTSAGLVVGAAYYLLDRLADPSERVTLIGAAGGAVVVRGSRGLEFTVTPDRLSAVPPDQFYRDLRLPPPPRRAC